MKKVSPFKRLVLISTLTKLADLLVSPKTTLPWLLTATGAPSWIISMLVPIKESGSLIPQWILKTKFAIRFTNRTALWRVGAATQSGGILGLVLLIWLIEGQVLAYSVLLLLMLISFGRAICSLSMKDIQGELVEKGRRGRLIGLASSISGGLTLISAVLVLFSQGNVNRDLALVLILIGSCLFLMAFLISFPMRACIEKTDSDSQKAHSLMALLRSETTLQQIIFSRVLLLHSALVVPFVVAASSQNTSSQLPWFVGLSALASMLSSYVWGQLADKGAVFTLRLAAMVCFAATLLVGFNVAEQYAYTNLILFFVLMLGHEGIRTGRKTYLLDITDSTNRTGYVAAANTLVGLVLITLGALYATLYSFIDDAIIFIMSGAMLMGIVHTFWLKAEK